MEFLQNKKTALKNDMDTCMLASERKAIANASDCAAMLQHPAVLHGLILALRAVVALSSTPR
jgi:hypothetical protein